MSELERLQEECRVRSVAIEGQKKQIDELIDVLKKVWQCSAVGTQPYGVARRAWDLAQEAKQHANDYIAEVLTSVQTRQETTEEWAERIVDGEVAVCREIDAADSRQNCPQEQINADKPPSRADKAEFGAPAGEAQCEHNLTEFRDPVTRCLEYGETVEQGRAQGGQHD